MLSRLRRQPDLPSALDTAIRDIVALHGAEFGNVQLVGDDDHLWIVAHTGFSRPFLSAVGRIPREAGTVCARALRARKSVHIRDVARDPIFRPFRALASHTRFRSVLSSPLISSEGACIGVVSAHFTNLKTPTDIEVKTLESYCSKVADHLLSKKSAADLAAQAAKLNRSMLKQARATA